MSVYVHAVTDQGNDGADLLLSKEDMRSYTEMFSSSTFCVNQDMQIFGAKYLNIMDPLKEKNNLGRSVSKGKKHVSCLFTISTNPPLLLF